MIKAEAIQEQMEVVGQDGKHVGTVDNLGIKLTKNDPLAHDQHHYLKLSTIAAVQDGRVILNINASEAVAGEKVVEN